MMLRTCLLPPLLFASINVIMIMPARKKFGTCLPFTMIISVLILYFSQLLFHTFMAGYLLLLLGMFIGLALLVLKRKELYSLFFTEGLFAFVVICSLFAIIDYTRRFYDFDEFWHWGMMVKEILRLDKFYCVSESNQIIHKDYPPFLAILEALWCKLGGRYSEGGVTMALHVFVYSMLIPPFSEMSISRHQSAGRAVFKSGFLTILTFLLISLFDVANTQNTVLADVPIAVMFAYAMLLVVTEECYKTKFGFYSLVADLTALIMIKQVGMAMFLVVILAYGVFLFCRSGQKKILPMARSVVLAMAVPIVVNCTWIGYVKSLNVSDIRSVDGGNGQFDFGKIDIVQYLHAVTGEVQDLRSETFTNLMKAFFEQNIADISGIPMTYVSVFLLLSLAILWLSILFKENFSRKKALLLNGILLIGSVGFAFMLSVMFLFCFLTDEMQELRGYGRYVDSYLIGEVLLLFFLGMLYAAKENENVFPEKGNQVCLIVAGVLLFLNPLNLKNLVPIFNSDNHCQVHEDASLVINESVPEGASVGVLYFDGIYGATWYAEGILQYYANGKVIIPIDYTGRDLEDENVADSLLQEITNCDYIYVGNLDEYTQSVLRVLSEERITEANSIFFMR